MTDEVGLGVGSSVAGRPPNARWRSHLVEQVAVAAASLSADELIARVEEIVVEALPVDHCAVCTAEIPDAPGGRSVPIIMQGERLGAVVVWRESGTDVCLTAAEKSELAGVAAVVGLAINTRRARRRRTEP